MNDRIKDASETKLYKRQHNAGAGNAGAMRANVLWNNQCAILAEDDDQFRWAASRRSAKPKFTE